MLLDRKRLSEILDVLSSASGNKVMEICKYILFQVSRPDHLLLMTATNFKAYVTVNFGDLSLTSLDDVPERFLIPADTLTNFIKSSTTKDVDITGNNNDGFITVKTNGVYKFNRYNEDGQITFPSPDWRYESLGHWKADKLKDIWARTSIALSKDVTKMSYQCVQYDGNWVATDNRRLAVIAGSNGITQTPGFLLLPHFGDVLKHCESSEVELGYTVDRRTVVMRDNSIGMLASFRLVDDPFLNYLPLLQNKNPFVKLVLNKQDFSGILSRMEVFIDKDNLFCDLAIKKLPDGNVVMRCSIMNKDGGVEQITPLACEILGHVEGDTVLDFAYNISNIRDAVNSVHNPDRVMIAFQTDGKLFVDEENYSYMLGPVAK